MVDGLFLIENRKMITTFNNKEIPADVVSEILNCARLTPTNKHNQEWKLVLIKDPETKKMLSQTTLHDCFMSAPVVIAFFSKNNKFKIEYTSAATQAMMLAANYHNLGTYWHLTYSEPEAKKIAELLQAPSDYHLMSLLAIGYYSFTTPSFQKMPSLSELTITEKFK